MNTADFQVVKMMRIPVSCLPFALLMVTGCHHQKQTAEGSMASPGASASVDNSWVQAAKSCWPDLGKNGYSTQQIQQYLITPANVRVAFPSYTGLSDDTLKADISVPLATILPPDTTKLTNSSNPVLTTGQAVQGTPPQGAIVQSTHGSAPPDALCAIQSGLPQGFNK